jgi:hypothetical protein
MRNDEAETISHLANETLEVLRKAEACTAADGIIRRSFGTDNRVQDMSAFYSALVEALQNARELGKEDRADEDVLLLTEEDRADEDVLLLT